jgi:hypothetical protein
MGARIAGFTSRTPHAGRHWLYYLAKVESAYTALAPGEIGKTAAQPCGTGLPAVYPARQETIPLFAAEGSSSYNTRSSGKER